MSSDELLDEKWIKKLDRQTRAVIDRIGADRKTLDQVFDKPTLLLLGKLISDQVIAYVDFPISTGKEAVIFRGVTPAEGFVALKIYRMSTLTFKHIMKYLLGDPRFETTNKSRREIIYEWTRKEYKNLQRVREAKVLAPKPLKRIQNILLMEYLGDADAPGPLLKDAKLHDPEKTCKTILRSITQMYHDAGLVHADLSSYNIIMHQDQPYIIDLGQGVLLEHPMALEFLKRDIHNIVTFFKRYSISNDEEALYQQILSKK
jgi:RIO kinase 1